jgi:hypothetical protein
MNEILDFVKGQTETRNKIRRELTELSNQNIVTQAKKAEELIANQVVYVEAIKIMGDDIFDLGVENQALRDKIGDIDVKWLNESKNRIKVTYDTTQKNLFILDRMKKQVQKLKQI